MQSEDDRLAKLAEKLHGVRDNLPSATPEEHSAAQPDVRVKNNSGNVNFGTQFNIGNTLSSEPIAFSQRRNLNDRVKEIAEGYGLDPRVIWREVIHTRFGVSSVGEISKAQFIEAAQALDVYEALVKAQLAESKEQSHVKRLVAEALQLAHSADVYQAMTRFCSREFGETALNNLNPDQLKQVLKFLDGATVVKDEPVKEPLVEASAASAPAPAVTSQGSFFIEAKGFFLRYPLQCGSIAFALMILGKIV
ncbi:hypothetical protein N7414_15875 [Pseudomonas sp. GD04087]|uniref:hypothetical protein n=1 Tax=unclassified Pseudomonas TaxID=196821 RepID=UPI0024469F9F|nr:MULTISPECIES: hypothetical protein [unclassified Pseudomonas]MDH0290603.1 hypothetical protein [Pseudomonas sp. GD04087]MDH1051520.1 hypothetical protein [Pseudomonas sp. GD03903]MDH2002753.1 hypothetical protein [Pseudomonas sp. GD03691]